MSRWTFLKRAGMNAIVLSTKEFRAFNRQRKSCPSKRGFDLFVPLPWKRKRAPGKCRVCDHLAAATYFEAEDSSLHGWCCRHCGRVVQLG